VSPSVIAGGSAVALTFSLTHSAARREDSSVPACLHRPSLSPRRHHYERREVSFLDSKGLMALLAVQKQAERSASDVAVVKPTDTRIWKPFELTALNDAPGVLRHADGGVDCGRVNQGCSAAVTANRPWRVSQPERVPTRRPPRRRH
jgi:hypothetical protein